jgi:hypothetical protein
MARTRVRAGDGIIMTAPTRPAGHQFLTITARLGYNWAATASACERPWEEKTCLL